MSSQSAGKKGLHICTLLKFFNAGAECAIFNTLAKCYFLYYTHLTHYIFCVCFYSGLEEIFEFFPHVWLSPKFCGQIKNILFLFIIHSSRVAQGKMIDAGGQDVCV